MDSITKLFTDLVKIPSPSGDERAISEYIQEYISKMNIPFYIDNSAEYNDSNTGNLIGKINGDPLLPTILLLGHMDTVEVGDISIDPIIDNDVVKSKGNTILGADDKAAIAAILETAKTIVSWEVKPNIILVFSTREERGIMGSSLLQLPEKVDFAFNVDGPNELGGFVHQTLGEVPFEITINGKAAHAAVEPEKGINAIKAASLFISQLPLGKDENGSTLNIGKIIGGKANNVIPDEVILTGQARAYKQENIDIILDMLESKLKLICKEVGTQYTLKKLPEEGAPANYLDENHLIISFAKQASENLGLQFSLMKGSYTTDANFLNNMFPTLTVCRGSKSPHSNDESISIQTLNSLRDLLTELVKVSSKI